jgi:hypothetical protein
MAVRKVTIEHYAPANGRLTMGDVAGFIRDATLAGAHGDETVRDPSHNSQLVSLSVEVEETPADRLARSVRGDHPAIAARALRRAFDPHDVREVARPLAPGDPDT